ncbi:hypothetical protein GWI33_012417 [Rhynchophorus ferrugineus]|uniref:Uncharacterized protein n=1 Tax=Rhynchophorus ferrugineus TaxID=354439 RepID=A0A834MCI1_RHYFE|nr:hypothetical protein GWI33_012417 [Rhynchophorus ferrugineus]
MSDYSRPSGRFFDLTATAAAAADDADAAAAAAAAATVIVAVAPVAVTVRTRDPKQENAELMPTSMGTKTSYEHVLEASGNVSGGRAGD